MNSNLLPTPGTVHLVGAGPGDPDLLTIKARRLLGEADAVVHDYLVTPEILAATRPDCERIFVGKHGGHFHFPQARINETLIALARQGKSVVRLKGGDPFVFGRGGEEAEALTEVGIPFEVVPGITAAIAAGAGAGVPLTHRAHSSAVVFLTGHECAGKPETAVRWEDYARLDATLCIYMGMHHLATIAQRLQDGGLSPETPAVIIQAASMDHRQFAFATLGTLAAKAKAERLGSPAIVIIGEVAAHRLGSLGRQFDPGGRPPPSHQPVTSGRRQSQQENSL